MKRTYSDCSAQKQCESVVNFSKRPKTIANYNHVSYMISFGKLKELVANQANNSNVLLLSLGKDTAFCELICDDSRLKGKDGNYIFLTVIAQALAIICDSDRDILQPFIASISDTDFHQPILNYLMQFESFVVNPVVANNRELHIDAFTNLVKFVRQIQLMSPQSSRHKIQLILLGLSHALDNCNKKGEVITQSTVDLLNTIKAEINKSLDGKMHAILLQPPNNFREISICPTYEDIHVKRKPFLRGNITQGKYSDVDHYLDVQFRLLREDYVRPLREGIASYLNAIEDNKRFTKLKDVRVYSKVRIVGSQLKGDLIFEAEFDVSQLQNVRWQVSNRLLPGSLLCLSYNNFQTFFFATITGPRRVDKLAEGFVSIKFETQPECEDLRRFTLKMIESLAYFEAYRYNLQALQTFNSENFPLQQYIISVSPVIENLSYLNETVAYDLTDLAYPLIKVNSDEFVAIKEANKLDAKQTLFDTFKSSCNVDSNRLELLEDVLVLDDNSWPKPEVLGFDESQFEAFKAALTKQMVIIQGPPGTGKTYIGLRIVQTLLRNSKIWNGERNIINDNNNVKVDKNLFQPSDHKPILIVCFTNHALDQFLEGMVPFCNKNRGIVRIGGRSKSALLQAYTLLNLKLKVKMNRSLPLSLYISLKNSSRDLRDYNCELLQLQHHVQTFTKKLLTASELNSLIDEHEWMDRLLTQLHNYCDDMKLALTYWLSEQSYAVTVDVMHRSQYASHPINNYEFDMDEDEVQDILDSRIIDNDYNYNDYKSLSSERETTAESVDYRDRDYRRNVVPQQDYDFSLNLSDREREKFIALMEREMKSNDMMTDEEVERVVSISTLSYRDRWRLYRLWVNLCCDNKQKQIEKVHTALRIEMRKYDRLKLEEDVCVIRGCDVIGMTTTGAAKYRSIIEQIDPSVVVIEEAAEVLESHVITSLTKSTNHLILIGDHQQLKPNPNVYELAKKFKLDVSLFERMINNGMPYYQLKLQHRMRPCISSLLVPHFYKELIDNELVKTYENIKGVSKNMFFLNHSEIENYLSDSESKFNDFEAEFVVYLCKYLVQQQYKPSQITIIVMYSAQLFKVKNYVKEHQSLLNGVRVTAVDNYQGEENDIIILSFVRSNIEGSIGFLQVSNRVNVALSRAKMGLYCIGNFDCLANKSQLWKNIKRDIEEQQAIGSHLEIYCQNHPTIITKVSKASDFSQVPDGGCNKRCDYRRNCGHVCTRVCHVYDRKHEIITCPDKCDKPYAECAHKCKKICHFSDSCDPCPVPTKKLMPVCGHEMKMKCSDQPSNIKCTEICGHQYEKCEHRCAAVCHLMTKECAPCKAKVSKYAPKCGHQTLTFCSKDPLKIICNHRCERVLACGHKCTDICGNACDPLKCKENVKILLLCGHRVNNCCSKRDNAEKLLSICSGKCGAELKCGHKCDGTCIQCYQKRLHVKCRKRCTRVLVCGHECKAVCGDNCPPCSERCQTRCYHSRCERRCGEPCLPCLKQCEWKCVHKQCTRKCSEKCDRVLCKKPCHKILKCGHLCIGLCGQLCPNKCRICHKREVQKLWFGDENKPNARFVQLEDCMHIVEYNGMVKWLSMSSKSDSSEAANTDQKSNSVIRLKCCPKCNTIIRRTKVFNSAVRDAARNVEAVKAKLFGTNEKNEQIRSQLVKTMQRFNREDYKFENKTLLRSITEQILYNITKSKRRKSQVELEVIKAKFNAIKQLARENERLRKCLCDRKYGKQFADINIFIRHAYQRISKLLKFIDYLIVINDQQVHDLLCEMNFVQFSTEIVKVSCDREFVNQESKSNLISAFQLLSSFGPFSDEKKVEIRALVEKAVKLEGGLGVSIKKNEMVVKATVGFSRGHWYKCPIGHVYCVGECDGANQANACPECKSRIVGPSQRLADGNAMVAEMGGSKLPA